jgi:membrane protease YdiL (CAAX protease family)
VLVALSGLTKFNLLEIISNEMNIFKVIKGCMFAVILNSLLFLGLLVQFALSIEEIHIPCSRLILLKENIYGPLIEEVIYRLIMFNLLKVGEFSDFNASLVSSLLFGLCKIVLKL